MGFMPEKKSEVRGGGKKKVLFGRKGKQTEKHTRTRKRPVPLQEERKGVDSGGQTLVCARSPTSGNPRRGKRPWQKYHLEGRKKQTITGGHTRTPSQKDKKKKSIPGIVLRRNFGVGGRSITRREQREVANRRVQTVETGRYKAGRKCHFRVIGGDV